jgi:uncharacterized membrane protein
MRRVSASALVPGPVDEAEALWLDTDRWATFVDGFATVVERDAQWPRPGGKLVWRSTPHGRGTVHEHVTEPGVTEFHDDKLAGTQTVEFAPHGEHTRVTLSMEYRIEDPNALTPIVDLLFVRRAMRDALQRTVVRFSRERQGDLSLP